MPRLSLGLGVGGSGLIAPAAPSGIPVASTASVVIAGGSSDSNWHRGTYQETSVQVTYTVDGEDRFKFTPSSTIYWFGNVRGFLLVPPSCSVLCEWYHEGATYTTTIDSTSNWRLIEFSNVEDSPSIIELNTNASSNGSFIPDTSWSAPAITITAAPSGIPVASTSQIIVTSTNSFIGSAPFNKIIETAFVSSLDGAAVLEYIFGAWTFYYDGSQIALATNPAGYIPTAGYTIFDGGGSITITAA